MLLLWNKIWDEFIGIPISLCSSYNNEGFIIVLCWHLEHTKNQFNWIAIFLDCRIQKYHFPLKSQNALKKILTIIINTISHSTELLKGTQYNKNKWFKGHCLFFINAIYLKHYLFREVEEYERQRKDSREVGGGGEGHRRKVLTAAPSKVKSYAFMPLLKTAADNGCGQWRCRPLSNVC